MIDVTIKYTTKEGAPQEYICNSRAVVRMVLTLMAEPEGLIGIHFRPSGIYRDGTRATLLRSARNGTLYEEE